MHPMPPSADLMPLVGDAVGQIWLDPYGVQFRFQSGATLSVHHNIEHVDTAGTKHAYKSVADEGPPLLLHRLLLKEVTGLDRQELSFTLRFADGATLTVHTELGPYECGNLSGEKFGCLVF